MIKCLARTDRGVLIVLGLSDANVDRMKQDDPVFFPLKDLRLDDDRWVAISYKHPNGNAAFPKDFHGIGLAFSDNVLDAMTECPQEVQTDEFIFAVFRGKNEDEMETMFRGLLGPQTIVTDTRPPSQKNVSRN